MTSISEARSYGGAGFFARLRRAWAERRQVRNTVRQLNQLTDHELSDIGIIRYDIRRLARAAVAGA